jgi:hypothetical protein
MLQLNDLSCRRCRTYDDAVRTRRRGSTSWEGTWYAHGHCGLRLQKSESEQRMTMMLGKSVQMHWLCTLMIYSTCPRSLFRMDPCMRMGIFPAVGRVVDLQIATNIWS